MYIRKERPERNTITEAISRKTLNSRILAKNELQIKYRSQKYNKYIPKAAPTSPNRLKKIKVNKIKVHRNSFSLPKFIKNYWCPLKVFIVKEMAFNR